MTAYYNENDPKAAAWLRELIARNLIAPGIVDDRSIVDVQPTDLVGFAQCHFFAGIGVWSYALRGAGWDDDRAVWTGSCPCQPFSSAGKGGGVADARHLWPEMWRLARVCRPDVLFGEQVASPAGLAWFDAVSADLESADYAIGAADVCAAGVGAPHIRQRLWWVAESSGDERGARRRGESSEQLRPEQFAGSSVAGCVALGDAECARLAQQFSERGALREPSSAVSWQASERTSTTSSASIGLGNANRGGIHTPIQRREWVVQDCAETRRTGATSGRWTAADWVACRDEKWRPVEPGTFPLAHGAPARVGRLRGYGNAIVSEVAIAWIEAYREVSGG